MSYLHVNRDKCTECGACVEVCPASLIRIGKNGPRATGLRACIACGHCVAVCPVEALDNDQAPFAKQVPLKGGNLDAGTAAVFLRSRRSIRRYKKEAVPRETLLQILDIASFASTGGNSQGLSYLVVSDKALLRKVSDATVDWMEEEVAKGSERAPYFEAIVKNARVTGKDVILRDAPHLIVAMCDENFPRGAENAHFALAYAELFAPTVGVGTCWAGLFQGCAFSGYAPLLDALGLPAGKKVAGGLMAGYPVYRYHRLVDRNPLQVEWR
jgi:nitroreductase/NAD-dependent dihydropyrimidine dehydrogenase PreA subunit